MKSSTKIEWTLKTWNPITGCSKISTGCANCYAERFAHRLQAIGVAKYNKGFEVVCHPYTLGDPYKWRKPHLVFVNSMSDLFHEEVPDDFIMRVFRTMRETPQHTYQILTKRSARLKKFANEFTLPENVWAGVTVEHSDYLNRLDDLRDVEASLRFVSCEPLLSSLFSMDLSDIGWVIVGGESGPNARPMRPIWVEEIFELCREAGTPFFFKQWGGVNKKAAGRKLHGHTYSEMPKAGGLQLTF